MEITKMLILSTAHISKSTAGRMTIEGAGTLQKAEETNIGVVVYNKGEYGWLIPIVADELQEGEKFNHESETPEDLAAVLRFAIEHDCTWVMFDRDAEVVESLPKYDW